MNRADPQPHVRQMLSAASAGSNRLNEMRREIRQFFAMYVQPPTMARLREEIVLPLNFPDEREGEIHVLPVQERIVVSSVSVFEAHLLWYRKKFYDPPISLVWPLWRTLPALFVELCRVDPETLEILEGYQSVEDLGSR